MCWLDSVPTRSAFLVGLTIPLGCSSNGDQILGRVVSDNAANIVVSDAGTSSTDANIGDCELIEYEAKAIPFDLYALIDRSRSMQDPGIDKWELLVTSFTRFLQSGVANGSNFGVGFFPMGPDQCHNDPRCYRSGPFCDPRMYYNARIEIGKLPDNYQPLVMSIYQPPTGDPTVTCPALEGSLDHAARWEASHFGRRVVQILITGGLPTADACQSNNVSDCVDIVASSSSSKTYVIAFGTDKTPLDPIAVAGGGESFYIDIRDMMTDRLGEIIKQIRDTEVNCEWAVPPPPSPGFDYGKLNVEVTGLSPLGSTFLQKVKNRQACNAANEWYYDNNFQPRRIIACNATCQGIHQSTAPIVRISLGCQTITAGPAK